jgi:hypothetical protein
MVDDLKMSFEICVADLLKEDTELVLDFFCFEEEIELILVILWEHAVDKLLELFWSCRYWEFVGAKRGVSVVDKVDDHIFGYLDSRLCVFFDPFATLLILHYQQSLL